MIWDLAENRVSADIEVAGGSINPPAGLAVSHDGRWAATGTSQLGLAIGVWDAETRDLVAAIPFDRSGWIPSLAFNPGSNHLAVLLPDGRL